MMVRYRLFCVLFTALFCVYSASAQSSSATNMDGEIISLVEKYNNGKFSEVLDMASAIIRVQPKNDAAYYYKGLSHFSLKELEKAEMELQKAVELDSSNFWYRQRLAVLYSITNQKSKAIEFYTSILKDFPKKHEVYYSLIELYLSDNKQEKALETLDQIDNVFGVSEPTIMTRYDILRRLDKQEEAVKVLTDFNEDHSSLQVLAALGEYHISNYNDSLALAYYDEALELEPSFPSALLGKAEVYRMTRKYNDYFEPLRMFVSEESTSPKWKSDYLTAVIRGSDPNFLRNYKNSFELVMEDFVQAHPKDSSVLKLSGMYFYAMGDMSRAKSLYKQMRDSYSEDSKVSVEYLGLLLELQDWGSLAKEAKDLAVKFPEEMIFLDFRSYAEYNLGNYVQALEVADEIYDKSRGNKVRMADALSFRGDVLYRMGEKAKAFRAYDASLKYDPNDKTVLNNYAYYLSVERKKLKKAHDMSKKSLEMDPDNATFLDTFGWILYLQGNFEEARTHFKRAMLYGGKESATVVDHYAEVLYELGDYDLAMFYWKLALSLNKGEITDLEDRVKARKGGEKR